MTVKELADVAGCNERTVRRITADLFPTLMRKGIKTIYTRDQGIDIMNALPKKNMVQMSEVPETKSISDYFTEDEIKEYRKKNPIIERKEVGHFDVPVTAPNQMDVLLTFMAEQQQANQKFMAAVMSELKGFKQQPLQIEQIKEDYYSLAAYCAIHGMKINRSEMAIHGRELKKICGAYGSDIHKIPDERWGKVNSYPIEILDEYFSV